MSRLLSSSPNFNLQQKTTTFTTPTTSTENYNAAGTALPTSEPATSQIIYTVGLANWPATSDSTDAFSVVGEVIGGGKNTGASSYTVNYRVLHNGSSVTTGNFSVSANNYWTLSCFDYGLIALGDVLELRLWATNASVDYRYSALGTLLDRYVPMGKLGRLLLNCVFAPGNMKGFTLIQGPSVSSAGNGNVLSWTDDSVGGNANHRINLSSLEVYKWQAMCFTSNSRLLYVGNGDYSQSASAQTSSAWMPWYTGSLTVAQGATFSYRPTNIFLV